MAEKKPIEELIEEYNRLNFNIDTENDRKVNIAQELKERGITVTDSYGLLPPQIDLSQAQREEDKPISKALQEYFGMLDEEEPVEEPAVEEPVKEPAKDRWEIPGQTKSITYALTGFDAGEVEDWAYGIGETYGNPDEPGGGLGNTGDAARHISLGWAAAKADEYNIIPRAKALVQAKEYAWTGTPGEWLTRDLEDAQDRHNNNIGFQLALMSETEEEYLAALKEAMRPENLIILKSVDDLPEGGWSELPEMSPVIVKESWRMQKGGPSASKSREDLIPSETSRGDQIEEPTVEPTEERTEERAARPDSSGVRQMTLQNYERPDVDRVINDIIYYAEMFDDNFADKIPGMRRVEGRPTPLIAVVSQEQAFDVGTEEHPSDQFKPRQITAGDRKRAKDLGISTTDLYQPHSKWDKSADTDVFAGNATGAARGIYQRQPNGTLSAVRFLIENEDLANGIFKEAKTKLPDEEFVTLGPIMEMIAQASEAAEAKRADGQYKNTVDSLSEPIEDEVTRLISTGYYPHLDTIMHLAYVAALDKRKQGYENLQQRGGTNYQNINMIQGSDSGNKSEITSRAIRLVEKYMNK